MRMEDFVAASSGSKPPRSRLVGENFRAIRLERNISLNAAAGMCSVSAATLSRIENGLMSPTFDVMSRICDGLGIGLVDLVRDHHGASARGWMTETRFGAGRLIETPQYRFEFLCDDVLARSFLVLRAEVLCSSMEEFGEPHSHSGQEQIVVQTGRVEVWIEQYKPKVLNVGDSIAFDSRLEHAVIAPGPETATVLWVFEPQGAR